MNFYRIGYHCYEECPNITLCHEKEFTKDEVEEMVIEALKIIIPTRKFEYSYQENFSELLFGYDEKDKNIVDVLCEKYGFSQLKYTADCSWFGWASIFDDKDWEVDSKGLNNIRKAVKELKPPIRSVE